MRSVTATVLLTLVVQANAGSVSTSQTVDKFAGSIVDKLSDRVLHASSPLHTGMDSTTMGKPGHVTTANAMPTNLMSLPKANVKPGILHAQSPTKSFDKYLSNHPALEKRSPQPSEVQKNLGKVGKFLAANAVGLSLMLAPMGDAMAARSGGRMGGSGGFAAARSRTAPKAAAVAPPVAQAPRTTNVYVQPAMPMGGYGMGYGMGMPGMGYGYSPFGGGMSTGTFLGIELVSAILREQSRQAAIKRELAIQQQLGQDSAKIAELQAQLQAQNSKVDALQAKAPPGTNFDQQSMQKMQDQLMAQQKELETLKAEKAAAAR